MRLYVPGLIEAMEESLGNRLRGARAAAGITVDDAVYRAKLPRAVVEALEAEEFGFFSSPLYARSFLKQYGEYVGVDVNPWIDGLEPTAMIDGEAAEAFIDISDPSPPPVARERAGPPGGGGGAMAAVWLIVITGGLVWGGIEFFRELDKRLSGNPPPVQVADPPKPAAKVEETPPAPDEPAPNTGGQPIAATQPEPPRRAIIVREE